MCYTKYAKQIEYFTLMGILRPFLRILTYKEFGKTANSTG